MAELVAFIVLLPFVGLAVWFIVASEGESDLRDDEPPTLNTRSDK